MTIEAHTIPKSPSPSRWWKLILALSLAANLLVIGMVIGHRGRGGSADRGGYMQLLPRDFFAELTHQRRHDLLEMMRPELVDMHGAANATSLRIADALEKQPFDSALVQQAVAEFTTGSQSLAVKGPLIIKNLVEKLTPEERIKLADAIRQRARAAKHN